MIENRLLFVCIVLRFYITSWCVTNAIESNAHIIWMISLQGMSTKGQHPVRYVIVFVYIVFYSRDLVIAY